MNRRKFIKNFSYLSAMLPVAGSCQNNKNKASTSPNILLIMSDDLCSALSGFGHPMCKTPNLDALAARGVRFEKAYCNWPVCGPSRASLMTGIYPETIKTMNNHTRFRKHYPNLITIPQLFKQNGYHTARVSKIFHMGIPGEIINGTAHADDPKSWDETYNIKAPEQNSKGKLERLSPAVKSAGMSFNIVKIANDLQQADHLATNQAIKLLKNFKKQKTKFFLGVGFVRPHVPLVAPKELFNKYPLNTIKLPYVPKGDLNDIPKPAQRNSNAHKYRMNKLQQHKATQAYYAAISYMDTQVGRVLKELKKQKLEENTIIIFTSDHGYNLGQHTAWQKVSLFEDTIRVPLIIAAPQYKKNQGEKTDKIVELIDIYPTLAELANLTPPKYITGQSLIPLLQKNPTKKWEEKYAYTTSLNHGKSIRSKRWHLNLWSNGKRGIELYDHQNDPNEYTNLAKKESHKKIVQQLTKKLYTIQKNSKNKLKKYYNK